MKLDLLTNASVVDDAIRFVSQKSKENPKSSYSNSVEDIKESNKPNYDELEQEKETGEITSSTTNQIF